MVHQRIYIEPGSIVTPVCAQEKVLGYVRGLNDEWDAFDHEGGIIAQAMTTPAEAEARVHSIHQRVSSL